MLGSIRYGNLTTSLQEGKDHIDKIFPDMQVSRYATINHYLQINCPWIHSHSFIIGQKLEMEMYLANVVMNLLLGRQCMIAVK
jgi:hypothetical protein